MAAVRSRPANRFGVSVHTHRQCVMLPLPSCQLVPSKHILASRRGRPRHRSAAPGRVHPPSTMPRSRRGFLAQHVLLLLRGRKREGPRDCSRRGLHSLRQRGYSIISRQIVCGQPVLLVRCSGCCMPRLGGTGQFVNPPLQIRPSMRSTGCTRPSSSRSSPATSAC